MYYSRQVLSIFFSLYSPQTIYILENILENIYFFHHTSTKGFTHVRVDHPPSPTMHTAVSAHTDRQFPAKRSLGRVRCTIRGTRRSICGSAVLGGSIDICLMLDAFRHRQHSVDASPPLHHRRSRDGQFPAVTLVRRLYSGLQSCLCYVYSREYSRIRKCSGPSIF